MGRRFLLILGMLAWMAAADRSAHGQEPGGPPPAETPAAPTDLPAPSPIPLGGPDGGLPPIERPAATPAAPGKDEPAPMPPFDPAVGDRTPPPQGDPGSPSDPGVTRTQAPRRPREAEPAPAPAADEPDTTPADRLPTGRQSVAVTVNVESPANVNLHQPTTVRLVLRNNGSADALQLRVTDKLPDGLKFLSSSPAPDPGGRDSALHWSLDRLPAGSDAVIAIDVEPVKTGNLEHGATVWFQTGSGSTMRVLQPRLKIEQVASASKVLKGHAVEFKIKVTNDGDGPAHKVKVVARLSDHLRYGTGGRGNSEVVTDPIPVLGPGQSEELDPLIADAITEGEASCTVTATSPDIVGASKEEEARIVSAIQIIEPKLNLVVSGPQRRPTDSVASYELTVTNPGSADARKVRVTALVPPGTRLLSVPKDARFDQSTRRLQWSIENLEHGAAPTKLAFEVRVGDVGKYSVSAEAAGTSNLRAKNGLVTEVFGMPDVDLNVSEQQRVVDVNGKTTFLIRLRNYGSKEATNITLKGTLAQNLKFDKLLTSDDVPADVDVWQKGEQIIFARNGVEAAAIPRLGPGKEMVIGLKVIVTAPTPKLATLHIKATHDDLQGSYEDMAGVKVLPAPSQTADAR